MSEFVRLPEVRIEGIEANIYMEPSLVEVDGKYRLHQRRMAGYPFSGVFSLYNIVLRQNI